MGVYGKLFSVPYLSFLLHLGKIRFRLNGRKKFSRIRYQMKKYFLFIIFPGIFLLNLNNLYSQADTIKHEDVRLIIPVKDKRNANTYLMLSGGYQIPSWFAVPMIPLNQADLKVNAKGDVKASGWFAGIGLMKRAKSNFEYGFMADFYKTSIPVAYAGQNSSSDWVLSNTGGTPYSSPIDIYRYSEVFAFRATVRYIIPAGNFQFWGGVAPGTFSSKVYYSENRNSNPLASYLVTDLGINFQAGMDFRIKNHRGEDMMKFGIFTDLTGPRLEESYLHLFNPGWRYNNSRGNSVLNPFRIGFVVGFS